MSKFRFFELCGKYLISPNIALENENLVQALRDKDDTEVERVLREEF